MSRTSDTANLFQTDAQHAQALYREAKSKLYDKAGQPIKLSSKPLRVIVRHPRVDGHSSGSGSNGSQATEPEAWIAESGFVIRRLGLESGKTLQIYRGHLGPVTSIAFYTVPSTQRELLISGSWDKSFRVWDIKTKQLLSSTIGHVDFVKAIHVLPALRTLATGSSDRDLRLWDLSVFDNWDWTAVDAAASAAVKSSSTSAAVVNGEEDVSKEGSAPQTEPAPRVGAAPPSARPHAPLPLLSILKGHTRPVERLVSYAITEESAGRDQIGAPTGSWALVSADSMGAMKTWELKRSEMSGEEESKDLVNAKLSCEWRPHEIGVYDINLNPEEGEMWTVSADSSLLLSRFSSSTPSIAPKPSLRIAHPSALKAVLYLPELNFVLTGAADEAIRAFDLASSDLDLDPSSSITTTVAVQWNGLPVAPDSALPGLVSRVEGHSHEVTDLHAYVVGQQSNSNRTAGSLSTTSQRREQVWVVSASVDGTIRRWSWSDILNPPPPPTLEEGGVDDDTEHKGLMTAEEEAELEALMVDH